MPGITSGPLTVEQFVEVYNRNLDQYNRNILDPAQAEWPLLVKKESTSRPFNERDGVQGIAKPTQNRDLEPLPQRSPVKTNKTVIRTINYRSAIYAEKLLIETAQHREILNNTMDIIESEKTLKDQMAADLYNSGFTTNTYSITEAGDTATAIFSATHKREDNGATFSNYLNVGVPPNQETLWNVLSTIGRYQDAVGNFVGMSGTFTLLTPTLNPGFCQAAAKLTLSPDDPETSDRAVNTVKQQFQIEAKCINNFTSSTKWFIRVDTSKRYFPMLMLSLVEPSLSPMAPISGNPDAFMSRLRTNFGVGPFFSGRGVFAIGT